VNCSEFRDRYSDFADGLLDEGTEVEARRHLADCPSCGRLHLALATGLSFLRTVEVARPSCEFGEKLRRRIGREAPLGATSRRRAVLAGALVVAGSVLGVAWSGLERPAPSLPGPAGQTWRGTVARSMPSVAFHAARDSMARIRAAFQLLPGKVQRNASWTESAVRLDVATAWSER
jgi:hypothetical protein